MKLQKFRHYIDEANAQDYIAPKDDDKEATDLKPRSKGEEDFKNMHKVTKSDAEPKGQEHVFNGDRKEVKEEVEDEKKKLIEGVLDTLRKIVKEKQAQQVKFSNGKKMTVDMQTANMIVNSIDKRITKPELKKKVEMMLDKDPNGFMKVLDIMNKN